MNKENITTLFLILVLKFTLLSQTLIGEFDRMYGGQFISNDQIALICNDCNNTSNNSIVFYEYVNGVWELYDQLTTTLLYPDMVIRKYVISEDNSTLSIILGDPSNTLVNDDDDVHLIFKKVDKNWILVFERIGVIETEFVGYSPYSIALSEDGNILITSSSNITPGTTSVISEISFEILEFVDGHYILGSSFTENIYSQPNHLMRYFSSCDEIYLYAPSNVRDQTYHFIKYTLEDSTWQKADGFIENEDQGFLNKYIATNQDCSNFVFAKSYSQNNDEKLTEIELISFDNNSIMERNLLYRTYTPDFTMFGMSASDDLKFLSLDFLNDKFSSDLDTASFIDYFVLVDLQISQHYKFIFPSEGPGSLGGYSQVSTLGDKIIFYTNPKTQVYDMSDFLSNTSPISEDDEYQHQNLTGSTIDLRQVEDLKIYNTIGQLLIETTTESIDLSAMPSGMYILHYLKNGYVTHVRKVMKF